MIRLGQFLRKNLVSLFRRAPQVNQTAPGANEEADDKSNKDLGPKPEQTTVPEVKVNPDSVATGVAESVQAFPPIILTNLANERNSDSKRATDAETSTDVPADFVPDQSGGTVTHAGQPEDMVSRAQDTLIQLSKLPSDSTTLRNYLESTSVKVPSLPRLASPRQVPQPRQVPSPRVYSPRHVAPPRPSVSPNRHSVSPRPSRQPRPHPNPLPKSSSSIRSEPTPVRPSSSKKNVEIKEPTEGTSETTEKSAEVSSAPEDEVGIVAFIEVSASTKEVVGRAMQKLGMKELTTEGYWNVRWSDHGASIQMCQKLQKFQRINRFPGGGLLMMKNNLAKETAKMKAYFPDDYDFVPETWCLSGEVKKVEMYAASHERDCFIVKPNDGSSGKGIIITRNVARLKMCEKMVCQVYIRRPYLIDGFKFDLRVYTLITSCRPLRLFVYNEALARFATEPYQEPNVQNESNKYMHLTNYAVNKHSPSYMVCETKGTLRRLSTINKWLLKHNIDARKVWDSMDDAIIKTIISFLPALKHNYRVSFPDQNYSNSCFQILGFDIIFDDNLKPYVLEVNDSPSFKADVPLDQEMTDSLILDTFNILHLDENNRSKVLMEERRASRQRLLSSSAQIRNKLQKEKVQNEQSLTQSRIAWEDTHMGNFRKVYPLPNDRKMKHYKKFIREAQAIFTNHV